MAQFSRFRIGQNISQVVEEGIFSMTMVAAANSWIIYSDVHRKKTPIMDFLTTLGDDLMATGR